MALIKLLNPTRKLSNNNIILYLLYDLIFAKFLLPMMQQHIRKINMIDVLSKSYFLKFENH